MANVQQRSNEEKKIRPGILRMQAKLKKIKPYSNPYISVFQVRRELRKAYHY